jgi:hypothetical protein
MQLPGGGTIWGQNFAGNNPSIQVACNAYLDSVGYKYFQTAEASQYQQNAGTHVWQTAASGTAGNAITFTQAMTLDASGNLGIGTSSPGTVIDAQGATSATRITVTNTANAAAGAGVNFIVKNGATTVGNATIRVDNSDNLAFFNIGGERARIDSSGNLLVGTTGAVAQITSVSSLASTAAGYFNLNAVSSTTIPAIYLRKYDNDNTTSQIYVAFQYNQGASASGGIQGNGATGVQLFSSSDARLKENIVELEPQLANIMALKPSKFDFIDGPKDCTGFIAQEMEAVYPDAIGETPDGFKTIGGISIMETRLIKCIQEQQALITQLQADVAALKGASA